jgi:hypothetical protein
MVFGDNIVDIETTKCKITQPTYLACPITNPKVYKLIDQG